MNDLYTVSKYSNLSMFNLSTSATKEEDYNLKAAVLIAMNSASKYFDKNHKTEVDDLNSVYIMSGVLLSVMVVVIGLLSWAEYGTNARLSADASFLLQIPGATCREQCRIITEFINSNSVTLVVVSLGG